MPTKKRSLGRILVDEAGRRKAGEEPVHGGFAKAGQMHDVGHAQAFEDADARASSTAVGRAML